MEPLQEESSILNLQVVKASESQVANEQALSAQMAKASGSQVLDEEALSARIAKVKEATSPRVADPRAAAGG